MSPVLPSPAPRFRLWLLVAAILFAATTLAVHQTLAVRYLQILDGVAVPADAAVATPLRSTSFGFAADAQTWIRHALHLRETGGLRLRYTHDDNAPVGRDVHWNSAWAWTIAGAGELRHRLTGDPIEAATEHASRWLNFGVLIAVMAIVCGWAAWRFGAVAAGFMALGIAANGRFYEGFATGYVDHHGLLSACVLALVLGAVGMVADATDRDSPFTSRRVRASAIFSAVAGAIGMWISAASVVPAIAIVGLGVIATRHLCRRSSDADVGFDAGAWRLWGAVGGALSLFFYVLEYFPGHLGLRLEVNHPLYALAWWSGAEWVAQLGAPRAGSVPTRWRWGHLGIALAGAALPAVIVGLRGAQVFSLLDPFMTGLHSNIAEFKSVMARIRMYSVGEVWAGFDPSTVMLLPGPALLLWTRAKLGTPVVFALIAAAAFVGMGLWQERWLLNASGPLIVVTWVVWEALQNGGRGVRFLATLGILAVLLPPPLVRIVQLRHTLQSQVFGRADGLQPLYRDVAAALRRSQPEGDIILLASPNASVAVGYYGRFQTIGTLYWENAEGLKAAARIFSAASSEEAAKLIAERRITHVAMISEESFIRNYYELLHRGDEDGYKRSFGYQLQVEQNVPTWLQVLPYVVPSELSSLGVRVLLFKVMMGQSLADGLYSLAVAQIAWKDYDGADRTLQQLTGLVPDAPAPWVRRSEIAIARKDWNVAIAAITKAIAAAPEERRAEVARSAEKALSEAGAPAAVVEGVVPR